MEILEKVPDRYLGLLDEGDNYMSIWLCAEIIKLEGEWKWVKDWRNKWYVIHYVKDYPMVYVIEKSRFKSQLVVADQPPDVVEEVKKINKKVDKIKRMIKKETIHEFAPL
jgi:hypothetical protein